MTTGKAESMTRHFRFSLGILLFLWIGLGVAAPGQALPPPAELSGAYDCSTPGFAKQKLIFLSAGRWVKGPRFDPAAFKMLRVSEKTLSFRGRVLFRERGPGLRGKFRIERDRVVLYPLPSGAEHFGLQSYFDEEFWDVQQFRIDPATGNLIEVPLFSFRPPLTCTRDGFF